MTSHPCPTGRSRWRLLLLPALVVLMALAAPTAALADPPAAATLSLVAPTQGKVGVPVGFTATLVDSTGAAVNGARVVLERVGAAAPITSGITGADGRVVLRAPLPLGSTQWQARYAGDATHGAAVSPLVTVTGVRLASAVALSSPGRVVDEQRTTLGVLWTASDGSPVSGGTVTLYQRQLSGPWKVYTRLRTGSTGRASVTFTPRVDTTWRAVGAAAAWWLGATSRDTFIDNVPATRPIAYPTAAPRPAYTPAQPRATGAGAHPVVTRLPNAVWRSMVGRSWHRGCPVGRSGLRLLRVNYWGFDGYRYRGEMVLASAAAGRAGAALRDMYDGRFPIRRMYRVDRFGWSSRVHGANDYASMGADNTSGFNCRSVVNRPGVLSPHARGRAIDVNTWENPYRSATGLVPNSWWASRSDPRMAWRSSSHPVVRIWRAHGFRWTYGTGDSQHVDGRTAVLAGSFTG